MVSFLDLVKRQYDSGKVNIAGVPLSTDWVTTATVTSTSSIESAVNHARTDESKFKFTSYGLANVSGGSYTGNTPNGVQMKIEFMTDAPVFEFRTIGSIGTYSVFVDGELTNVDAIATPNGQAATLMKTECGEGVIRRMRHVEIYGVNTSFGGLWTGPNDTVTSEITVDPKPFIYQMGDSYTYGTGAGYVTQEYGSSPAVNDFYLFRRALGFDGIAEGIGGSGWNSSGGQIPTSRLTNRLLKMGFKPDVVSFALAYNDAAAINTGSNSAQLQSRFQDAIDLVRSEMPGTAIIHISCATPKGITTNIQKVIDLTNEVCANNNIPVIGISNYVTNGNSAFYTGTDNVHPNPLGHEYRGLAMAREALMAALEGRSLVPAKAIKTFRVTLIARSGFAVNVHTVDIPATDVDNLFTKIHQYELEMRVKIEVTNYQML